ncbi:MAG: TfoX/Sxy family protein [Actinobacteria bacterium]|nr:TfoX/Sxy family protein [Actinomycetota bacterium]
MAYDDVLAARVREILIEGGGVEERRMFGGLTFMVGGHMCCGVIGDELVLRLGVERAERALRGPHVRPMDFTGRPLKGFVFLGPGAIRTETQLRRWLGLARNLVSALPPK